MEYTVVNAPCGAIKGYSDDGVRRFLGVRYATAERFCMPKVVERFDGEYDATRFGRCSVQYRAYYDEAQKSAFYHNEFRKGCEFSYGEDCLNLNVYAPENAKNSPVVLFIHGGSFIKGSNSELPFDGAEYCKRGVILAAVNYRLNAFGMLSDGSSPFNLALYDQLAALEWVFNNISAFGGNPENITLMGQSAGAISVQILILNSKVKAMVRGAVMLSGGGFLKGIFKPHGNRFAVRLAHRVMKAAGASSMSDLKSVPEKDLFDAWQKASSGLLGAMASLPVADSGLANKDNYKNFSENAGIGKRKLKGAVGYNDDVTFQNGAVYASRLNDIDKDTDKNIPQSGATYEWQSYDAYEDGRNSLQGGAVRKNQFEGTNKHCKNISPNGNLNNGASAEECGENISPNGQIPVIIGYLKNDMVPPVLRRAAENYARRSDAPTYIYRFNRSLPGDDKGAWHSADLWYFFGTMERSWRPFEKADYALSSQMIDYVCNFAARQNPNGNNLPEWCVAPDFVKIFDVQ